MILLEKYIIVTGASSGIGRAIAMLLSNNYPLILCGRNSERLEETRTMCTNPDAHVFWNYDLADVENISKDLSALIKNKNISIYGFVHSAGIAPLSPLNMLTTSEMHNIMDVNFFSAAEILKLISNRRVNGKNLKSVILISSVASIKGTKGMSMYSASKGAIDAFVRSMACELAPNTRVNSINPGPVTTHNESPIAIKSLQDDCLLGLGEPNDIAHIVEFLINEKTKWVTGQNFIIDGGYSIHS